MKTDLASLMGDITSSLGPLFAQMDWADDEIEKAQKRHPDKADVLYHAFGLLTPTHNLMSTEFVYRSHCRELLECVALDVDTRPGTAAEVACLLHDASLITPLRPSAAGLYFRMWRVAFPDHPIEGITDNAEHYEALEGSSIDALERESRRKLTRPDRKLGKIECQGHHHGEDVDCIYADSN